MSETERLANAIAWMVFPTNKKEQQELRFLIMELAKAQAQSAEATGGIEFDSKELDIRDTQRNNLSVSLDYDDDPDALHPVLLFTPDMVDLDEHYHIDLNAEQARALRDWLNVNVPD